MPNLVSVVKAYIRYEKNILEEITVLRTAIIETKSLSQKAKIDETITADLKKIFAVAENYPLLRSNENFLKLQDELKILENQIADRREFYNDSVFLYNTKIHSFPDLIIAWLFGMRDFEYFKATEEEKKDLKV